MGEIGRIEDFDWSDGCAKLSGGLGWVPIRALVGWDSFQESAQVRLRTLKEALEHAAKDFEHLTARLAEANKQKAALTLGLDQERLILEEEVKRLRAHAKESEDIRKRIKISPDGKFWTVTSLEEDELVSINLKPLPKIAARDAHKMLCAGALELAFQVGGRKPVKEKAKAKRKSASDTKMSLSEDTVLFAFDLAKANLRSRISNPKWLGTDNQSDSD